MVPGVIALLLLVVTANLSSMAIVRECEVGTLEQLNVTPLGRWDLILAKLTGYGAIGVVDVLLVTVVATWWFECRCAAVSGCSWQAASRTCCAPWVWVFSFRRSRRLSSRP